MHNWIVATIKFIVKRIEERRILRRMRSINDCKELNKISKKKIEQRGNK
jgi:hypothetical protein